MLSKYLELKRFRRYVPDWITAGIVVAYFFLIAEHSRPFDRQFKLNDPTIQHPFATSERVTGPACLVIAALVPSISMVVLTFIRYKNSRLQIWHVLQVSILGLALSVSIDGVVTDILKVWVGRPRPDFLLRCGPREGTPRDSFVDISVCSAPLGASILADGMRSTPSGHLSISFSACLYLSMWIYGQFHLLSKTLPIYSYMFAGLPLLLASYIALSRTQDYRHHFVDIFLGGALGCAIAITVYHKYFQHVFSERSNEILGDDDESLPL